ncbi:MAG: hypothetical protein QME77_02845 [bacterium]|nr:hypothetical protein [bacterium]
MLGYSMIEYLVQHHVEELWRERESDRLAAELACQEEAGLRVWAGSILIRLVVAIAGPRALLSANYH